MVSGYLKSTLFFDSVTLTRGYFHKLQRHFAYKYILGVVDCPLLDGPRNRLQKVGGGCSGRNDPLRVGHGTKQFGLPSVDVLEDHDGCNVPAAVAVVGRRPHGHQLLVKHELVAFVHQLVSAADEFQVVDVDKLTTQQKHDKDKVENKWHISIDTFTKMQ